MELATHVMMKPEQARQGDVMIFPLEERPYPEDIGEVITEGKRIVLAHGEVTGHAHAIYPEQDYPEQDTSKEPATLYELSNPTHYVPLMSEVLRITKVMYLKVRQRSTLRHEEHAPISLAPGDYAVWRQVEFPSTEKEAPRIMAD